METTAIKQQFVQQLTNAITVFASEYSVKATRDAIGGVLRGLGGKVPKNARMKSNGLPKQLCPVPKCGSLAAPVFGMVCAKHKHLAKSTIKRYREARKARKARKTN